MDSEDLPLSLSREKPQNSNLLRRIKDVVTRKFLRFLSDEAKNNPINYREFYVEYHMFLKEGACQDYTFMDQLSKLLLFESSASKAGEVISLDDYISRCTPEQKHIYYLVAPSREAALQSPYYETFKKHKKEVLFLYNTIDDFVFSNIKEFGGKDSISNSFYSSIGALYLLCVLCFIYYAYFLKNLFYAHVHAHKGRTLISAETSSIDLQKESSGTAADEGKEDQKDGDESSDKSKDNNSSNNKDNALSSANKAAAGKPLTTVEGEDMCSWLTVALGSRVREVRLTSRLSDSPAIVTDHESGALRRMMKMVVRIVCVLCV